MELIWLKLLLLFFMLIITFCAGMLPVKLLKFLRKSAATASTSSKHRIVSLVLCLLTCFSGGVFLATSFLHLFPELSEHLNKMQIDYDFVVNYPLAELLACVGFFLLFFLEESILLFFPGHVHSTGLGMGHNHSGHNMNNGHSLEDGDCAKNICETKYTSLDCTDSKNYDDCQRSELIGTADQVPTLKQRSNRSFEECRHSPTRVLSLAEPEACETNCESVNEDPPILMKSRPHAHSHGVRSITFILALSFHSIIEGIAFGVQDDETEVFALFISLMIHKVIVAFSVGLQLARTHAHALRWVCASLLVLASMSPLGSLVGMFVQNSQMDTKLKDIIILIFQGLAVGTFIYVTFFEVLLHERDNEHPNLLKLFFMIIGFTLIGLLRLLDNHTHSHDPHGHSHAAESIS